MNSESTENGSKVRTGGWEAGKVLKTAEILAVGLMSMLQHTCKKSGQTVKISIILMAELEIWTLCIWWY